MKGDVADMPGGLYKMHASIYIVEGGAQRPLLSFECAAQSVIDMKRSMDILRILRFLVSRF